ncbi:hypothetical protein [Arcicella rosea]|uniref:Uncharacterized protein n=1 Tax=Arcicella rosea TaxID=502909 RepID=A0A841EMP1_9BACT|nr:hypothetical protein [Arcicella rosea]MBB6002283.1 hypothetical protein [Arcicella rosea]
MKDAILYLEDLIDKELENIDFHDLQLKVTEIQNSVLFFDIHLPSLQQKKINSFWELICNQPTYQTDKLIINEKIWKDSTYEYLGFLVSCYIECQEYKNNTFHISDGLPESFKNKKLGKKIFQRVLCEFKYISINREENRDNPTVEYLRVWDSLRKESNYSYSKNDNNNLETISIIIG